MVLPNTYVYGLSEKFGDSQSFQGFDNANPKANNLKKNTKVLNALCIRLKRIYICFENHCKTKNIPDLG